MTVSEVLQTVYDILNESSSSPFLSQSFSYTLLSRAIDTVYERTGIVTKKYDLTTETGVESYSLPSDFFTLVDSETSVFHDYPLKFTDFHSYRTLPRFESHLPVQYAISGNRIYLYPVPSQEITVQILYIPHHPAISSDSDTINLPDAFKFPLACYVAWMYKYRDRAPDYGDRLYMVFENELRRYMSLYITRLRRPVIKWHWLRRNG